MKKLTKRDKAKLETFFKAYDMWATSPDQCGGERFDDMLEARGELEKLFPPIQCPDGE